MADITMCRNHECTQKEDCYRYKANPNPMWQSFAFFFQDENGVCKDFWKIEHKTS